MTRLPPGWCSAQLGDVCKVVGGATPKTGVPSYWGDDVPWVTPADLSRDRSQVVYRGERGLSRSGYESCSARVFPAGAVIVSSRAPIGYVAIAGTAMCTNQGCKTAVPPSFIDSRYLYWYLVHAKPDMERRASGTTFKEISARRFAETELRWPPLPEQRRIVEVIEEHFSRLDVASALLATSDRRLISLQAEVIGRTRELAARTGGFAHLGELATDARYGTSAKCVTGGPGLPVVRIPNLVNGVVNLADEKRVADPGTDVSSLRLAAGDLLVVRTNGSPDLIGRTAVVQPGVDAAFASYLIRFKFRSDRVRPSWVHLMMQAASTRALLEMLASSSAGQYNLSLQKLNSVQIPVPPLEEQDRLLAQCSGRLAEIRRVRDEIRRVSKVSSALGRALLSAAFTGRLSDLSVEDKLKEMASV